MDQSNTATFRIWRGNSEAGCFKDYVSEASEGMVVLDVVHQVQAEQAPDLACRWNCKAGKCGSCSAEINGKPRLMCMTRLDQLDLTKTVTIEPMRSFPLVRARLRSCSGWMKNSCIVPAWRHGQTCRCGSPGRRPACTA